MIVVRPGEDEVSSNNFGDRLRIKVGKHYRIDYLKIKDDGDTCPKIFPTLFIAPEDTSNSSDEHQSSSDDMSFLQ